MKKDIKWWYDLPRSSIVSPETRAQYEKFVFAHFAPAPYVAYAGQPNNLLDYCKIPGDRKLVYVIGDSTVATSSLCHNLQEVAEAKNIKISCHNDGVIAANSSITLARLVHQAIDTKPDVVVIVGGGVDVSTPLCYDPRPGYPHLHIVSELLFEHFFDEQNGSLWTKGIPLTSDMVKEGFFARIEKARTDAQFLSVQWERDMISIYRNNIKKILKIAGAFNLKLIYILQPLLIFKTCLAGHENETFPSPETAAYLWRQYFLMTEFLSHEATLYKNNDNIKIVDYHDIFKNETQEIFADFIHCLPQGTRLFAEAIFKEINPWLGSMG